MSAINTNNNYTVILADGAFPHHALPLEALRSATQIICCDGAAKKLIDWGRIPDAIVGDLDSLSDELKLRFADRIYRYDDQETNDLTKAVNWCVERNIGKVLILGATGLRDDHTLGNISLLVNYATSIEVEMMTDAGIFTPLLSSATLPSSKGQQVSIFAITPGTEIITYGLKYNVHSRRFSNWWQGSLNEAEGNSFRIEFTEGQLIIFRAFPIIP